MKKAFFFIVVLITITNINMTISSAIEFDAAKLISPGELTKSHAKLSGIKDCIKCHTLGKGITDSACLSCHDKLVERINANKGFHAVREGKCFECHTEHKGASYNIMPIEKKKFDHKRIGYELLDKHKTDCNKCHKKEKTYMGLQTGCIGCHNDVHRKTLPDDCTKCHDFKGWKSLKFDHEKNSKYKLTGKHSDVKCESCHPRYPEDKSVKGAEKINLALQFKPIKNEKCDDCHFDVHKSQLKEKTCARCHATDGWEKKSFEHNDPQLSDYKLAGKHGNVSCEKCHPKETIKVKSQGKSVKREVRKLKAIKSDNCSDCHFDVHKEQFKDQRCDACHTVKNEWKKNIFKHEDKKYKGYKLEGKHAKVECEKCHAKSEVKFKEFSLEKKATLGKFKPLKYETCNGCHEDIHKGKYEQRCDKCHAPDSWKPKDFLHDPISFELKGAHKIIGCNECHENTEIYTGLESDCSQCHKREHNNQFLQSCRDCHKQVAWIPVNFKHTGVGFRLSGTHKILDCKDCHLSGDFRNASTDCFICHQNDYQSAPNHISSSYPQDCTECHISAVAWVETNFKHTSFTFRGPHSALKNDCSTCHNSSAQFPAGTSDSECFNCHSVSSVASSSYEGVSSPSHTALGFSYTCTDCHSESTWTNPRYTHQSYNLRGTHTSLNCDSCHQSGYPGQYTGATEDDCYTCHANDHSQQHPSYPQTCTQCHSTSAWLPASAHQSFNLVGVHQTLNCIDCHQSGYPGQYAGTAEDDCYACHASQHASQHPSFPTDCTQCHSTSTWVGATQHQTFSLIGIHKTLDCIKCHATGYPGQYAGTSEDDCYTCHASKYAKKHSTCPQDCTLCHNLYNWDNPDKDLRRSLNCD